MPPCQASVVISLLKTAPKSKAEVPKHGALWRALQSKCKDWIRLFSLMLLAESSAVSKTQQMK